MSVALLIASACSLIQHQESGADAPVPATKEQVVREFLHAWNAYKKYAWGYDDLKPLSKKPRNWYADSLLFTPVDALDTMLIMRLDAEAAEAKQLIFEKLDFDKDIDVHHFEIVIRLLGGLLSAYQMDGDKRFLELATDLADRMLPVFDSPTGMPYRYVNLKTGAVRGKISNPAEIGTCMLEYGTLSKLTGNDIYYDKAKRATVALHNKRGPIGLVGSFIDIESGKWVGKESHVGGGIDSYLEYLLKSWKLFGDPDFKEMWIVTIEAVNKYLADESGGRLWYGHADMISGKMVKRRYGALYAFFPALLALDGDIDRAAKLQDSGFAMWQMHGIEPERMNYEKMRVTIGAYLLRPEIVESAYYLYHYTGDEKYRNMGAVMFNDIVRRCRVEAGFASLLDVRTNIRLDRMESFFFAETLKYFYLLFAPADEFDFENVIFNTEAHPLKKTWGKIDE